MGFKHKARAYLDRHPRVSYMYGFARHFRDSRFFDDVAKLKSPPVVGYAQDNTFIFKTYGGLNKDRPLYCIEFESIYGLMAYFNTTVRLLAVADYFGFTPVVNWQALSYQRTVAAHTHTHTHTHTPRLAPRLCEAKTKALRSKDQGFAKQRPRLCEAKTKALRSKDFGDASHYGDNVFEYYFEQPCGITHIEAMNSYQVSFAQQLQHQVIPTNRKDCLYPTDEHQKLYDNAVRKYIRLNASTESYISACVNKILGQKKTLGVHVRGGTYKQHCEGNPVPVYLDEYVAHIKEAIEQCGFEQLFLATDEQETIGLFREHFGDMVVCYSDVTRTTSSDNLTDINFLAWELRDAEPDIGYRIGLDVLADVYTLAACQGLICGTSNVPLAAISINGGKYEYKNILYKGIYGVDAEVPKGNTATVGSVSEKVFAKMADTKR